MSMRRRRRTLFAGFVARMEDMGQPEPVMLRELAGRTKERIAQSKRACAGLLALVLLTSHK